MKISVLFFLFFSTFNLFSQTVKIEIPDPSFRNYLLEYKGKGSPVTPSDGNFLEVTDIGQITELMMSGLKISDAAGLEYFTELTLLDLSQNELKTISLKGLKKLRTLNLSGNSLTEIDLSESPEISELHLDNNRLTKINLTMLTGLITLTISSNDLGIIDLSQQLFLEEFDLTGNPGCPLILTADIPISERSKKDEMSEIAVLRGDKFFNTVFPRMVGAYRFGDSGFYVIVTSNTAETEVNLEIKTDAKPSVNGELPNMIDIISPDKYWMFSGDDVTGLMYSILFDLSDISGIQDFSGIDILWRQHSESSWQNTGWIDIVKRKQNPYIMLKNFTVLGDFAVGSTKVNSLPVELISFTAQSNNEMIFLNWSTATESNNAGWEVEVRRFDSAQRDGSQSSAISSQKIPLNPPLSKGEANEVSGGFNSIAFIPGKGTTTESHSYQFQVESSKFNANRLEFRLKQIDLDGNYSYSQILTVNVSPNHFELTQNYPNPFNPITVISYKLQVQSDVRLVVFDLLGREVATLVNEKKEAGNYNAVFDASTFSAGIYFYKLSAGEFSVTKKMLLVK